MVGGGGGGRERERVLNDQNAKCNHSFRLPIDGHGLFNIVLQSLLVQFLYPSQCFHRQCRQRVADNECVRGGMHWFRFQTAGHTRPHVQQVLYSLLAFLVPACKVHPPTCLQQHCFGRQVQGKLYYFSRLCISRVLPYAKLPLVFLE